MSDFIKHLLQEQRKAIQAKVNRRRKSLEEAEAALKELEAEIAKLQQR